MILQKHIRLSLLLGAFCLSVCHFAESASAQQSLPANGSGIILRVDLERKHVLIGQLGATQGFEFSYSPTVAIVDPAGVSVDVDKINTIKGSEVKYTAVPNPGGDGVLVTRMLITKLTLLKPLPPGSLATSSGIKADKPKEGPDLGPTRQSANAAKTNTTVKEIGTFKLDEQRNNFETGQTRIHTVIFETVGDEIKISMDGTDADGGSVHSEWKGKFDGNHYPVMGDSSSDSRAYKDVGNGIAFNWTAKKNGTVTAEGLLLLPNPTRNNGVLTIRTTGMDGEGRTSFHNYALYRKQ